MDINWSDIETQIVAGVIVVVMTVLVPSLIAVGWGIIQFTAQQRQVNRQPFLQRQLELCFLATETAARLASETDPAEWEKARLTFWQLYWGPLSIVEDRAVENAMVEFGRLVPENGSCPQGWCRSCG